MTLTVNRARYHLEIHQEDPFKPYLLMLHGFMGDSRSFKHLLKDLNQVCNPVTIDLLGHGKTEKVCEPKRYREDHQIADLEEIILQIPKQPTMIYGYSMGGRLALKTASAKPGLFRGIILESTNPGILNEGERKQRKATDMERAQEIEKDFEGFLHRWEKLPLFQSKIDSQHEIVENYKQMQQAQDPKAMAASLRGFGTGVMEPVTAGHQEFRVPALLLAGSEDQKYVASNNEMKSLFIDVSNHVIPAGHRVHLDNPQKFTQHITSFITQIS